MSNWPSTVLGGLLAIAGGLVAFALAGRRERHVWIRDSRLRATVELLAALQAVVRRMLDIAYADDKRTSRAASARIEAYHTATIGWNQAIYRAMLVGTVETVEVVASLDREVDRLLDLALASKWDRAAFRNERLPLGRLAAKHLDQVREAAGLPKLSLRSIWAWDR